MNRSLLAHVDPWPDQVAVCEKFGARPCGFSRVDRAGVALATLSNVPINGLRIPALCGASGWYIWGGGSPSQDADFYQPMCTIHLKKHCAIAVPYLFLPAGWRFQIDGEGYEDVWFDETLLAR